MLAKYIHTHIYIYIFDLHTHTHTHIHIYFDPLYIRIRCTSPLPCDKTKEIVFKKKLFNEKLLSLSGDARVAFDNDRKKTLPMYI